MGPCNFIICSQRDSCRECLRIECVLPICRSWPTLAFNRIADKLWACMDADGLTAARGGTAERTSRMGPFTNINPPGDINTSYTHGCYYINARRPLRHEIQLLTFVAQVQRSMAAMKVYNLPPKGLKGLLMHIAPYLQVPDSPLENNAFIFQSLDLRVIDRGYSYIIFCATNRICRQQSAGQEL